MTARQRGVIIISTFSDEKSAARLADSVVRSKLCACVNITRVRSIYAWHGRLEDQAEWIALFKTTAKSARKLKDEIARIHPYEVPEIVEVEMSDVSKSYLSWLAAGSSPDGVPKKSHNSAK
ncbi:MAG: divalent-cation tolerance protein CutA [Nitrososphaera sp.]|nr:divalent-cation tolerance protein CutA [Nitrososphaera sp.]